MRALTILFVTAFTALALTACCCPTDKCCPAKDECCDKTSGHYSK